MMILLCIFFYKADSIYLKSTHTAFSLTAAETPIYFSHMKIDDTSKYLWKSQSLLFPSEYTSYFKKMRTLAKRRLNAQGHTLLDHELRKIDNLLVEDGFDAFAKEMIEGDITFIMSKKEVIESFDDVIMIMQSWDCQSRMGDNFYLEKVRVKNAFQNRGIHRNPATVFERQYDGNSLMLHAYSALIWQSKENLLTVPIESMTNILIKEFGERIVKEVLPRRQNLASRFTESIIIVETNELISFAKQKKIDCL